MSVILKLKGCIGVAKRVHWLEAYDPKVPWATSICGKWAGLVRTSTGDVTCLDCKRMANALRSAIGIKE